MTVLGMLNLFAGPGGFDKGADIIGLSGPRHGVDLDVDACATARAAAADWTFLAVATVAAEDLGTASRRTRTFLIATRRYAPDLNDLPMRSLWTTGRFAPPIDETGAGGPPLPRMSMACALNWPAGERVNTRGNRRTSGGNEFPADGLSWCLTEKIRSWKRVSDGTRFTPSQAGLLMGFPPDYPWQGSPTKRFLQAADAVAPPVAAVVLGATLGIPWRGPLTEYLASIYGGRTTPAGFQPSLFAESAA